MRSMTKLAVFTAAALATAMMFSGVAWAAPELTYHGQFRINYYLDSRSDTSAFGDDNVAAHRLRWRPTFDVKVSDTVAMHTQFNIGHIRDGFGNHNTDKDGNPSFGLRHALIQAQLADGVTGVAGIVPVSDKFGDTLFSGDWDFNPITLAFIIAPSDGVSVRLGAAKLLEGSEMKSGDEDDVDAYVGDVDFGPFGASVYYIVGAKGAATGEFTHTSYGVRYADKLGDIALNAFVLGATLDSKAGDYKSSGFAGKAEAKIPVGDMNVGVMVVYASGDKKFGEAKSSASAFITPMSLIGHHGYWGYTGKLNIQGPTDTGIDDPVNIDGGSYSNANLGRGLTTVQANISAPLSDKLGLYAAVGWFQSNDAPSGSSKDIGTDVYVQGKYNLGESLNLEFGVDYAALGAGSHMTVAADKTRSITTVFSRLQLEY